MKKEFDGMIACLIMMLIAMVGLITVVGLSLGLGTVVIYLL